MQTVLTIAGFDPSSGAGITADLAVIAAHGLFGISAVTALTVQSTTGVRAVHPVTGSVLTATLECLAQDLPPAAVKIGMLATTDNVRAVADFLDAFSGRGPVVLDPVLISSSGKRLLEPAGIDLLRDRLLPLVGWITPNLNELAALTGLQVQHREQMTAAAAALQASLPELNILVTGGHLDRPDDLWLRPGGDRTWYPGTRIESRATHGTGCAFSTALMCALAAGQEPDNAIRAAKNFVAEAIYRAPGLGEGRGPMNLLWPLQRV